MEENIKEDIEILNHLLETAIKLEKERIDKLIDMEIERRVKEEKNEIRPIHNRK